MTDLRIIEGNSPSRIGKIHWREWRPKNEALIGPMAPDLVLLHPMPHDGGFFSTIAPLLAAGRTVLAPDYPGYGQSDYLDQEPSIELYAQVLIDMLRARDTHGPADLLGFHSGCLVATEMALRYTTEVNRTVQIDVPYFSPEKRGELLQQDWATGGFRAAFQYPSEERYSTLAHPVLVIATDSSLADSSREAAALTPQAQLLEMPDVKEPALVNGAVPLSAAALNFLNA